jgi:hypothetical protein
MRTHDGVGSTVVLLMLVLVAGFAQAHHGWGWASAEEFEITGTVTAVALGNPHGEVTLRTDDGEEWVVEVGQPWRNARAGLSEDRLAAGTRVTVHGHRSADPDERLIKAERLTIDGEDYVLYPDRAS